MKDLGVRKRVMSICLVFLITFSGFIGFCVFEPGIDEGIVEAATTRFVGGTGTGNYSNIQAALDAASPGDTIRVYAGTFSRNIYINTSVTIIGNGSANSIITGNGPGNVINIQADWVTISEVNIANGNNFGIYIQWNHHNITITDVNVSNCDDGIYADNVNDLNISYCEIYDNDDYGIYINHGWRNIICNNNITYNQEQIIVYNQFHSKINSNYIFNGYRGILNSGGDSNEVRHNIIANHWDEGIRLIYCTDVIESNSIINTNYCGLRVYLSVTDKITNITISSLRIIP